MIKCDHLIGLRFEHGKRDCYEMLRDVYCDVGVELPPVARPDDWWDHGMDLYMDYAHKTGFRPIDVHPRDYKPLDVFAMSIRAPVINHVGVYLGDGYMIHHFYGRLSERILYGGLWKNTTVGVFRNIHVKQAPEQIIRVDLMDVIPDHLRQMLKEHAPSAT